MEEVTDGGGGDTQDDYSQTDRYQDHWHLDSIQL